MAFGTDLAGVADITYALSAVGGRLALGQAVARRLSTTLGFFSDWPDYGYDLRTLIGTSFDPNAVTQRVLDQCLQEEEVLDASVTFEQPTPESLLLTIKLQTEAEPFEFTLSVDAVTVEILTP